MGVCKQTLFWIEAISLSLFSFEKKIFMRDPRFLPHMTGDFSQDFSLFPVTLPPTFMHLAISIAFNIPLYLFFCFIYSPSFLYVLEEKKLHCF